MELQQGQNRIFATDSDGNLLAEITYPATAQNTVDINHTFVHASLRGQGYAGRLMKGAAEDIRSKGLKAVATCSYAVKWFSEHPEYSDILL